MVATDPQDLRPVRHATMTWTSFDRFGRYASVAERVAAHVGLDDVLIDVGDSSGYLQQFLPDCRSIAVDLHPSGAPFGGVRFIRADGTALPLPDDAVAGVVSCDALEHLPPDARDRFVGELSRIARDVLVLAAPFDTFGVRGAEDAVARYAKVLLSGDQPQLTEHAEHGLPDLEATAAALARRGWDVEVFGEGNLHDWLGMMLLRFSTDAHESTVPLGDGLDVLYNNLLHHRSGTGPYYRHVLLATPGAGELGEVRGLAEALAAHEPAVDALAASFVGQISLLATAPALRRAEHTLDQIEAIARRLEEAIAPGGSVTRRTEDAAAGLGRRVDAVAEQVGLLRAEHGALQQQLAARHRRSVTGIVGRVLRWLRVR